MVVALAEGQPNTEFDERTVRMLFQKYDSDDNGLISVDEFKNLFYYLNEEYSNFLDVDVDSSGTIDARELVDGLRRRTVVQLTQQFYECVQESCQYAITFDNYLRLIARFDKLCDTFKRQTDYESKILESLLFKE